MFDRVVVEYASGVGLDSASTSNLICNNSNTKTLVGDNMAITSVLFLKLCATICVGSGLHLI